MHTHGNAVLQQLKLKLASFVHGSLPGQPVQEGRHNQMHFHARLQLWQRGQQCGERP